MTTGTLPEGGVAVPIGSLRGYHLNPRKHADHIIKESLQLHGQYRALVVNRGTRTGRPNEILAGNGTWAAAKALGWEQVSVTYVDVDDEQAARIVLVDNRANDLSGYDNEMLARLLEELPDTEATGYNPDDLDDLLAELDRVVTLPPAPTDATYNEDPEAQAAREVAPGETLVGRGLREMVLVLPAAYHDELSAAFNKLRHVYGDQPQGQVALRAARMAVTIIDAHCDCKCSAAAREAAQQL